MKNFRQFFEEEEASEEEKNLQQTLAKLPKSHQELMQDCKIKFQGGNTLTKDDDHIGYIDSKTGHIVVAAPWNYSREFTFLHEVGHRVFDHVNDAIKHQWIELVKNTQTKYKGNPEETFCMFYAQTYAKHKLIAFAVPEFINFIKRLT